MSDLVKLGQLEIREIMEGCQYLMALLSVQENIHQIHLSEFAHSQLVFKMKTLNLDSQAYYYYLNLYEVVHFDTTDNRVMNVNFNKLANLIISCYLQANRPMFYMLPCIGKILKDKSISKEIKKFFRDYLKMDIYKYHICYFSDNQEVPNNTKIEEVNEKYKGMA